jgi:hypothetical protein
MLRILIAETAQRGCCSSQAFKSVQRATADGWWMASDPSANFALTKHHRQAKGPRPVTAAGLSWMGPDWQVDISSRHAAEQLRSPVRHL